VVGVTTFRLSLDCGWRDYVQAVPGLWLAWPHSGCPWTVVGVTTFRLSLDCGWRDHIQAVPGLWLVRPHSGCPWTVVGATTFRLSLDCGWRDHVQAVPGLWLAWPRSGCPWTMVGLDSRLLRAEFERRYFFRKQMGIFWRTVFLEQTQDLRLLVQDAVYFNCMLQHNHQVT